MRIVHIADTHLGMASFNKLDASTGMNLREQLIYENFLASIDRIIAERPGALVHAGDLFDRVRPKTRAYTTILEALDRLKEAAIPLVVIAGNHSMPKTRYTSSPFEVLSFHPAEVYAVYGYRYETAEIGGVTFHCIPNMLRAEDYLTAFNEIEYSKSGVNVLVTHGLASTLRDRRLRTVAEHELNPTMFSGDFDYIALGHFHSQQQVADNAWYSGSIEFCSYGEIHDIKGGLLVDLDRNEVSHLDLPHTPMVDLGAIACESLAPAEISERIVAATKKMPSGVQNPMVQLTLSGIRREDARAIDRRIIADIRSRFLDFRLRIIPVEDSVHPCEEADLRAIDYVAEFERFLDKKSLDPASHAYIVKKGQNLLRSVLEKGGS